jgi:hypothetical protein
MLAAARPDNQNPHRPRARTLRVSLVRSNICVGGRTGHFDGFM